MITNIPVEVLAQTQKIVKKLNTTYLMIFNNNIEYKRKIILTLLIKSILLH